MIYIVCSYFLMINTANLKSTSLCSFIYNRLVVAKSFLFVIYV